jgi:hypothetical protein
LIFPLVLHRLAFETTVMPIFINLSGKELPPPSSLYDNMHSVVIWFDYGLDDDDPFYELSFKLQKVISEKGVGLYDGHEMELFNSDGSFYMYGPNAEILFKAVLPVLRETDFMKGAIAVLRFGPGEDAKEIEVEV